MLIMIVVNSDMAIVVNGGQIGCHGCYMRWSPEVPSSPNYSMILWSWQCLLIKFFLGLEF